MDERRLRRPTRRWPTPPSASCRRRKWTSASFSLLLYFVISLYYRSILFADAFNLDTSQPTVYNGNRSSLFGFTVLEHSGRQSKYLMVGAPNAATGFGASEIRAGAVYRLSPVDTSIVEQIPFDTAASDESTFSNVILSRRIGHIPQSSRDGQWLGATLVSSGPDGIVASCAPRYTYISANHDRKEPVGVCYVSRDERLADFDAISPCHKGPWGYHRQGSCQAGMSAALSRDEERVIVGAPGSWYWQGQVFSYDRETIRSSEGEASADALDKTPEGAPFSDDSYLGYSMATGKFSGRKQDGRFLSFTDSFNYIFFL